MGSGSLPGKNNPSKHCINPHGNSTPQWQCPPKNPLPISHCTTGHPPEVLSLCLDGSQNLQNIQGVLYRTVYGPILWILLCHDMS